MRVRTVPPPTLPRATSLRAALPVLANSAFSIVDCTHRHVPCGLAPTWLAAPAALVVNWSWKKETADKKYVAVVESELRGVWLSRAVEPSVDESPATVFFEAWSTIPDKVL